MKVIHLLHCKVTTHEYMSGISVYVLFVGKKENDWKLDISF